LNFIQLNSKSAPHPNPLPKGEGGRADWLIISGIVLLTFALYFRVAHFEFINFDDGDYVDRNPTVKAGLTWAGVKWAFTTGHAANWHPLTWLSLMLDVQLLGVSAGAIHLVNVVFHAATAALLFVALRRMTCARWSAAFAACVFAVHPLHVESVAWIAERKDVLAGFFWVLTTLTYVSYVQSGSWWRYAVTLGLLALGLMCKPMLVTLPLTLILLDIWPLKRVSVLSRDLPAIRQVVIEKIPMLLLAAASAVVTYYVQSRGHAVVRASVFTPELRISNAVVSYATYLRMTSAPYGLGILYPHIATLPGHSFPPVLLAICGAVLAAITILAVGLFRRAPWILMGWLFYLGTLVPVIGLVQVGTQALADRYMYIPMIGPLIMIAWSARALCTTLARRATGAVVGIAAIVALSIMCWTQIGYWRDSETIMRHTIAVAPLSYGAYDNLGEALDAKGDHADAAEAYRTALRINRADPLALYNLAIQYDQGKDIDNAIVFYRRAIAADPSFAPAYSNLAFMLAARGEITEPAQLWRRSLELEPKQAAAHHGLGLALLTQGHVAEGIEHLRESLQLKPDQPDALASLAWVLATSSRAELRDGAEADRLARRACELTHRNDPVALDSLAAALACEGNFDEAITTAQDGVTVARSAGKQSLADSIESRLQIYREHKPFVQQATRATTARSP
jgi:tetratricopeptide (TPR) repeat protein